MPVSVQKIQNQVKEGRHWHELLSCRATRQMGAGLLLLLPVSSFGDIVRKTTDPIWTFLLNTLPNLCPRILELAKALTPISEAIDTEGIGLITYPLLGYELRSPTNIHNLTRSELQACLNSYERLRIPNALRVIKSYRRGQNPDKIRELVRGDWERKNKRDGNAFLQRADDVERSAQRQIKSLRLHGNQRLQRTVINMNLESVTRSDRSKWPESQAEQLVYQPPETSHVAVSGRKRYRSPQLSQHISNSQSKNKVTKMMENQRSKLGTEHRGVMRRNYCQSMNRALVLQPVRYLRASQRKRNFPQKLGIDQSGKKSSRSMASSSDNCTSSTSSATSQEAELGSISVDNTEGNPELDAIWVI
jgi:hypothetical protein